jgi:hypothetical protein
MPQNSIAVYGAFEMKSCKSAPTIFALSVCPTITASEQLNGFYCF